MASIDVSHLSPSQRSIIGDADRLGSGTLWVPMGTGKTRLALSLSLMNTREDPEKRPGLFVVSKSLISEWTNEIQSVFGDKVRHLVVHSDVVDDVLNFSTEGYEVVITTPEVLSKHYKHYHVENAAIQSVPYIVNGRQHGSKFLYKKLQGPVRENTAFYGKVWSTLVVDEAQKYLNPTTIRTKALLGIYARKKWLLSGTPFSEVKMETVFGYHLLLDLDTPRTRPDFKELYNSPGYKGVRNTIVYREKNEDYIPEDLGQKIITKIVSHSLSEDEMAFYQSIKNIIQIVYDQLKEYKDAKVKTPERKAEMKKMRGMLLGMISYIRQALVCPIIPLTSMYLTLSTLDSRDSLTDSFTGELIKTTKHWVEDEKAVYSSRYQKVVQLINKHKKDRIVIFSDYRTTLDVLRHYIPESRDVYTIRGEDKIKDRGETVEEWEKSEGGILLLTYSIGSCGLNLQKGQVAIIMDYGWNIDITKQAIARIVRRGQTSSRIHLYYLTSNTGMEEAIYKLHGSKKQVGEGVLDGNVKMKNVKISLKEVIRFLDEKDNCVILKKNV